MAEHYDDIVQLYVELAHLDPAIWRRIHVPADFRLRRVHDTLIAVFDWSGWHLHVFEVGEKLYGQPDLMGAQLGDKRLSSDNNVKLGALLERGVERFTYRYDFGDDWIHTIVVEKTFAPEPGVEYPVLVAGEHRAPPEDCGGPDGFVAFIEAMADEDHPDHEDMIAWYGWELFEPTDLQLDKVEAMLGRIRASRRKGPKKGTRMPSDKVWAPVGRSR